jgi:hypothetical protein
MAAVAFKLPSLGSPTLSTDNTPDLVNFEGLPTEVESELWIIMPGSREALESEQSRV